MRWRRRAFVSLASCLATLALVGLSGGRWPAAESSGGDLEEAAADWGETIQRRLSALRRGCDEAGDESRGGGARTFLHGYVVDPASGLAYCHVPKVASTWMLHRLAGVLHPELDERDLRQIVSTKGELHRLMLTNTSGRPPAGASEESLFRVVFVRHPLRRLVSAYVSKFERARDPDFINPLLRFVRRRRDGAPRGNATTVGFPDFVDFALDEVRRDRLSFGTLHWMPYHRLCDVCQHRLKMVGKLETMREDLRHLSARLPSLAAHLLRDEGVGEEATNSAAGSRDYRLYLGQLSPRQKADVCRLYRRDFAMFRYDCDMP